MGGLLKKIIKPFLQSEVKTVHCLVLPFYFDNVEPSALARWKKNIAAIAKNPETALIIINTNPLEKESKQAQDFSTWSKKKLGRRAIIAEVATMKLKDKAFPAIKMELEKNKIMFADNVEVIAYGQHALMCVPEFSRKMVEHLKLYSPGTKFRLEEHTAHSMKSKVVYLQHIIRDAVPQFGISEALCLSIIEDMARGLLQWGTVKAALRRAASTNDFSYLIWRPKEIRSRPIIRRLQLKNRIPR